MFTFYLYTHTRIVFENHLEGTCSSYDRILSLPQKLQRVFPKSKDLLTHNRNITTKRFNTNRIKSHIHPIFISPNHSNDISIFNVFPPNPGSNRETHVGFIYPVLFIFFNLEQKSPIFFCLPKVVIFEESRPGFFEHVALSEMCNYFLIIRFKLKTFGKNSLDIIHPIHEEAHSTSWKLLVKFCTVMTWFSVG